MAVMRLEPLMASVVKSVCIKKKNDQWWILLQVFQHVGGGLKAYTTGL